MTLPVGYVRAPKPKPALTDAEDTAPNTMRLVIHGLMAHRRWQVTAVAEHIERGRRMLDRGELNVEGANWLIRQLGAMAECEAPSPAVHPRRSAVRIPSGRYMLEGRRFLVGSQKGGKRGIHAVREQHANRRAQYLDDPERTQVLAWIASDPRAAADEYEAKTARCNKCHRLMFDPESVRLGRGPDCRKKYGLV